jgi:MoxR-like ATPase
MPHSRNAEGFYMASASFVDQCLRHEQSLFSPGRQIWSAAPVAELYERFVENPDEAKDVDFTAKLVRQLKGGSADVFQLAAEMLFVLLMPQHTDAATRRKGVEVVLSASPEPVGLPSDLAAAFDGGIASYGAALTQRFNQYVFLCEFARAWTERDAQERDELLADVLRFREFVFSLPRKGASSQVEALLHMVFPDDFEPIVSVEAKQQIADAFAEYAEDSAAPLDQRLASIRAALEEERGEFDFYDEDLAAAWRGVKQGATHAWLIRGANDHGVNRVPDWLRAGYVSIGWEDASLLKVAMSRDELFRAIKAAAPEMDDQLARNGAGNMDRFFHRMKIADLVVTLDGQDVYVGRITGDAREAGESAIYDEGRGQRGAFWQRDVEWLNSESPAVRSTLPPELQSALRTRMTLTDLTKHAAVLEGLVAGGDAPSAWDEFLKWAQRLYVHGSFDAEERDDKLATAEQLRGVRNALLTGGDEWLALLGDALKQTNLLHWRASSAFVEWCESNHGAAVAAIEELWRRDDVSEAEVNSFALAVEAATRPGGRTSIASVLLMGVDPLRFPPYRPTVVTAARKLLELGPREFDNLSDSVLRRPNELAAALGISGLRLRNFLRERFARTEEQKGTRWDLTDEQVKAVVDEFAGKASEDESAGERYFDFLDLVDDLAERMKSAGTPVRDRLDGQSLLWWVTHGPAPDDWPAEQREEFMAYQTGQVAPGPASAVAALAAELTMEVGDVDEMLRLVRRKKQAIFYGPPGTGKTFVARKLARYIAGDESRVRLVQLHPSYAYEDFVEGFRPDLVNGQPGFALIEGPFKRIAESARADPEHDYVLVIDEINRGNVAKVLGELYFLLEYREETIDLQYSRTPFSLPDNLFVLGTMNTADRSIALLDTALRRRFYFIGFFPGRTPIRGLLRRWLAANKPGQLWAADAVDAANELLSDDHIAIGHSFFIEKDLDDDFVREIWRFSILPTIEEHFFGEAERIAAFDVDRLLAMGETDSEGEEADEPAPLS